MIMKTTMIIKKLGLTIGGLVLTLSLAGCGTNSSVKSSSDNSSSNTRSSSSVKAKKDSAKESTSSATKAAAVSSNSSTSSNSAVTTPSQSTTSQAASSQAQATTTPNNNTNTSSTATTTPTDQNTIIGNFAKAAGYYGSSNYSFMVTGQSGSDYTIEVRATDGDSQVQNLVGIFDYNASTNTYTAKY